MTSPFRNVVAVSRAGLPGFGVDRLSDYAEIRMPDSERPPTAQEMFELVEGVTGLLCLGNDTIDEALLDAAGSSLRIVALASMGYDAVDCEAAASRGVTVSNAPGVLSETTADLAFSLILMARRRLIEASDSLRSGNWRVFRMQDYLGLDVHGSTLGLVGYGQIGRAVARRANGFGMRVIHFDPAATSIDKYSTPVDFGHLLETADIVSLHVPLTESTRNLIGERQFNAMKPTSTLVNTSRGGIVDESALLAALAAREIYSAGLDVFENEPVGVGVTKYVDESRLVVLPHVGSATEDTRAAMVDLAVDNVIDVLEGRPARTALPPSGPGDARKATTP